MKPGCRIGAHVIEGGAFEPDSLAMWTEMMKPDHWAIDVGAYTGIYSIAAAKCGAKVIALEPMSEQRERLQENARINGVEITTLPVAASDKIGTADIHYNASVKLTSGASLHGMGKEVQSISTVTIDSIAVKPVAAIKIDAERHEASVLKGAAEIIARDMPGLIVECLADRERSTIMELLPKNYRIAAVMDIRNLILLPLK
jgi:FkbM family methyltransferase